MPDDLRPKRKKKSNGTSARSGGPVGARGKVRSRGQSGARGPAGAPGPRGGLSQNHIDRIADLRQEVRDALKDAEPVKELQHQVHDALKHAGEIGDLRQQMQAAQKDLNIQFQRIAQIQAQLDKLMASLTSSTARREDT
jgi:hypothetical protein